MNQRASEENPPYAGSSDGETLAIRLSLFRCPQRRANRWSDQPDPPPHLGSSILAGVEDNGLGVRVQLCRSRRAWLSTATVTPPAVSAKMPVVRPTTRCRRDLFVGDVVHPAAGPAHRLPARRDRKPGRRCSRFADTGRFTGVISLTPRPQSRRDRVAAHGRAPKTFQPFAGASTSPQFDEFGESLPPWSAARRCHRDHYLLGQRQPSCSPTSTRASWEPSA